MRFSLEGNLYLLQHVSFSLSDERIVSIDKVELLTEISSVGKNQGYPSCVREPELVNNRIPHVPRIPSPRIHNIETFN